MITDEIWGPLSQSIRADVPPGSLPWRDNAYVTFWDESNNVYGTLHVSTSPNDAGGRARVSIQHGQRGVELVEPLAAGTFCSDSIIFDGGTTFSVKSEQVEAELTTHPLFALADYNGANAPKALGLQGPEPLRHYQGAASVTGYVVIDGHRVNIDGVGFRDRTWGFRDEAVSMVEYYGYMFTFNTFAVTVIRMLDGSGNSSGVGFRLNADRAIPLTSSVLTRDASGLFAATTITFADGQSLHCRATARRAGFWCPLGAERTGPVMSAYDEFVTLRADDGRTGFGLIEQGAVKRLS